jgi:trimethylamine:corrinoid methyltransferase-like protein
VFERIKGTDIAAARSRDPVEKAHEAWKAILGSTREFRIDSDRRRAIAEVVKRAAVELAPLSGAAE